MVIAEVTVIPIGEGTSLSKHIAKTIREIEKTKIKHRVTPTSTIMEGSLGEVLRAIEKAHTAPFKTGAKRVITIVKIDERKDKKATIEQKMESLKKALKEIEKTRTKNKEKR